MFKEINRDWLLRNLNKYFISNNAELFVVGGFIRDKLLGKIKQDGKLDIDICGSLSLEQIISFCKINKVKYQVLNKNLQVIKIFVKNKEYEYARFRKESYNLSQSHLPSKVEFTTKVEEDHLRRDFTINSIYYSLKTKQICDFMGGTNDLNNKVVRAVGNPEKTMGNDPARIIRMVELACRLGFNLDCQTLQEAQKNAQNVFCLTETRLIKEVDRLRMKNKYGEDYTTYLAKVKEILRKLGIAQILTNDCIKI